ncbi:hypothetical protein BHM03_00033896 [Ensete ventricosum]|uniref:Uncharacterized protein n=1 Tax=Ensete ventricosum TaxID=4639 RepID=A0A445MJ24_ENSVE|nr:hypothetical protein BHM03_00033896 [Ensete ventricosum]
MSLVLFVSLITSTSDLEATRLLSDLYRRSVVPPCYTISSVSLVGSITKDHVGFKRRDRRRPKFIVCTKRSDVAGLTASPLDTVLPLAISVPRAPLSCYRLVAPTAITAAAPPVLP